MPKEAEEDQLPKTGKAVEGVIETSRTQTDDQTENVETEKGKVSPLDTKTETMYETTCGEPDRGDDDDSSSDAGSHANGT